MRATDRVLAILARGPRDAGSVGVALWPHRRTRTCAVQGGGDYAAQMLLGRLRRRGLVRVRHRDGDVTSVWEITTAGLAAYDAGRRK